MQVILYMFANPPISPFLNSLFVKLDSVFPLFGTFAFAVFCFYLIGALPHITCRRSIHACGHHMRVHAAARCAWPCMRGRLLLHAAPHQAPCAGAGVTIKGTTKVGLSLLVTTVHPMTPGATLMSSMLFNTALVLLATNAAIQFCAQAFALYSSQSAIQAIWGDQVRCIAAEGLCQLLSSARGATSTGFPIPWRHSAALPTLIVAGTCNHAATLHALPGHVTTVPASADGPTQPWMKGRKARTGRARRSCT